MFQYKLKVFFRECVIGEINRTDIQQCFRCEPGTYVTYKNETNCKICKSNAKCPGG